jgi:NAD(P)-dependent dehydrogenase (short-subunit alcohol dehydrogenase family)
VVDGSLSGRAVVVFGGAGALGRAVVSEVAARGASVTAVDRVVFHGGNGEAVSLDVGDERAVAAFFAGRSPWAVVNVIGGYTPGQPLAELDLQVLNDQLSLNLVSAATVTKHALSTMIRAGTGGRIVHTSSRVAYGSGKGAFAYSVSKLGVVRLVEAAAAEAVEAGITVNCIVPSIIDTPANRASIPNADHERWPKPAELAAAVALLLGDDAALVSGAALPVYGRV